MPSEDLIGRLARDLRPVRHRRIARDALILAGVCVAEIVTLFALGLVRPALHEAMDEPLTWWKFSSMGLLAVIGGGAALQSFDRCDRHGGACTGWWVWWRFASRRVG